MSTLPKDYFVTSDGSVISKNGEVIFFSMGRFQKDICEGDCCFICGGRSADRSFNDEHVIPDWILRDLEMHSKTIALPNGSSCRYDQYKIRCCENCNYRLAKHFEEPVSELLKGGMPSLTEHLRKDGPWLLFIWLSLIYLKTHLRDRSVRWHLDAREGTFPISEAYDWKELHHIHCMARAFLSKPHLDHKTLGTFFIGPASTNGCEEFDYGDLYSERALCLRFRGIVMIAILNDSCACFNLEKNNLFQKIKGELSPLQIREIMSRLGYLNSLIKERPVFFSNFSNGQYSISATLPDTLETNDWDPISYGRILHKACSSLLASCANPDISETQNHMKSGQYTFLFDKDGRFIENQMRFLS